MVVSLADAIRHGWVVVVGLLLDIRKDLNFVQKVGVLDGSLS